MVQSILSWKNFLDHLDLILATLKDFSERFLIGVFCCFFWGCAVSSDGLLESLSHLWIVLATGEVVGESISEGITFFWCRYLSRGILSCWLSLLFLWLHYNWCLLSMRSRTFYLLHLFGHERIHIVISLIKVNWEIAVQLNGPSTVEKKHCCNEFTCVFHVFIYKYLTD